VRHRQYWRHLLYGPDAGHRFLFLYRPDPRNTAGWRIGQGWRGRATDLCHGRVRTGAGITLRVVRPLSELVEIPAALGWLDEHFKDRVWIHRACSRLKVFFKCGPGDTLGFIETGDLPRGMDPDGYRPGPLPFRRPSISA